jgi:hypothetical protein
VPLEQPCFCSRRGNGRSFAVVRASRRAFFAVGGSLALAIHANMQTGLDCWSDVFSPVSVGRKLGRNLGAELRLCAINSRSLGEQAQRIQRDKGSIPGNEISYVKVAIVRKP